MTSRFALAKEAAIRALDDLVPELFGGGRAQTRPYGNRWAVLNKWRKDAKLDQMTVWRDGARRGAFKDFVSGEKGDIIDLIAFGRYGAVTDETRMEAVKWLEERFSLRRLAPADRARAEAAATAAADARADAAERDQAKARTRARKAFYGATADLAGTPAARYLKSRGVDIAAVPNLSAALHFRPDCEYWPAPGRPRFPAIVSAMVDAEGHVRACHYTFLEPDGGRKLDTAGRGFVTSDGRPHSAKLMYPATAGLFIPLTYGPSGLKHYKAPPLSDICAWTEGIEDGLSAALSQPDLRFGAAGSLSGFLGLPDLACARAHLVFEDNDWGKPQARALFRRGLTRLAGFGKPVETVAMPADWGKDVNDALTFT